MDSIQPRAARPRSSRLFAAATPPFPATANQSRQLDRDVPFPFFQITEEKELRRNNPIPGQAFTLQITCRVSPISALRDIPIPHGISRLAAVHPETILNSCVPAPTMDPLTPSHACAVLGPGGNREKAQEESRNTNAQSSNREERTRRAAHTKNPQIVHSMHSPRAH